MPSKDRRVLIIEDDTALLKVLTDNLHAEGYQIFSATDGVSGFEKVYSDRPDIVLLDLILPRMDGITILKKLSGDERTRQIPVIILTNLDDADKVASAMEAGVYDYLQKTDWHISDVVKKVKEKLGD